jgi:hypothetical protein
LFQDKLGVPFPGAMNPLQMDAFINNAEQCYAVCVVMTDRPSWGQIWARHRRARERPLINTESCSVLYSPR